MTRMYIIIIIILGTCIFYFGWQAGKTQLKNDLVLAVTANGKAIHTLGSCVAVVEEYERLLKGKIQHGSNKGELGKDS